MEKYVLTKEPFPSETIIKGQEFFLDLIGGLILLQISLLFGSILASQVERTLNL